jgi:hypothetical protein
MDLRLSHSILSVCFNFDGSYFICKTKNKNKIPPLQPTGKLPFSDPEATLYGFISFTMQIGVLLSCLMHLKTWLQKRFLPTTAYMFAEATYKKQITKMLLGINSKN